MIEPLERYVKVGIVHFMAFPETMGGEGPVLETVRKIAEDEFFNVIEVTQIKEMGVRDEVRKCIEASGLEVFFGAQPMLLSGKHNLNSEDGIARESAIAVIKEAIEQALFLGAKGVSLLSGPDPVEEKRETALDLLTDSLEQVSSYAMKRGGINITLETFDRDVDKKCLIGPAEEAVKLAGRLRKNHSNFGLMYDLSHMPLLKEQAIDALGLLKPYLVHIHIGNCVMRDKAHPAYGDMHPRFGIKGGENGVPELAGFLKALLDMGYLSDEKPMPVSFEVRPLPSEASELVIANAKRTLRAAWSLL